MMKFDDYKKMMDLTKEKIENYPLEINQGTKKMKQEYHIDAIKKRNQFVESEIKKYTDVLDQIKTNLNKKMNSLIPTLKSAEIEIVEKRIVFLDKILNYASTCKSALDKLDLNKRCYLIDDIDNSNIELTTQRMLSIIETFKLVGIEIKEEDFDYSTYTKQYMKKFFESLSLDDFNGKMKQNFDEIYWNCPNILTHLKLNFFMLYKKYDKKFVSYCNNELKQILKKINMTLKDVSNLYCEQRLKLELLNGTDSYLIINSFVEKTLLIDDYMPNSEIRKQKSAQFLIDKNFDDMSQSEKDDYFKKLIDVKNMLIELENITKYEFIYKDISDKYQNKDAEKVKSKEKEIKKIESKKNKNLKKYYKIIKKKNKDISKINLLLLEIDNSVMEIKKLNSELDEIKTKELIKKNISDGSTLYDAFLFVDSNYSYMHHLFMTKLGLNNFSELENEIKLFDKFISNPNNVITNKISLFNSESIENMINNKCKMLGINIVINDLNEINKLKNELDFIENLYYIEKSNVTFEQIKFICDVKSL